MAKATKEKDLDEVKKALNERYGKDVIVNAGDLRLARVKRWIPTGSLTLDMATGGKGIPAAGKSTCILGKESASKTTLCYHMIAESQKQGDICAFLAVEEADLDYAESCGVNLSMLHLIDRESLLKSLGVKDRILVAAEEWLEMACKMLQSNTYGIVALDSVAALQPLSEIQGGLVGGRIAGIASVLSKAYRAINNSLANTKSAFVYTNQYRINPGGYGNPFIEPGGEALRYLQDLKIEISKSLDKDNDGVHGIIVKGKITKSKVCSPYKEFSYYIEFGKGLQRWAEIMSLGLEFEIIAKEGNTYSFDGTKLAVGIGALENFLQDNPELVAILEQKVLARMKEPEVIEEPSEEIETEV